MKMKVLELEIDEEGRICLPEFLIRRLCLRKSVAVPLVAANDQSYFMPSAFSAMLLGSLTSTEITDSRESLPPAEDDHEWTDEEIVAACKELRRAVNKKH